MPLAWYSIMKMEFLIELNAFGVFFYVILLTSKSRPPQIHIQNEYKWNF